ncbi:MAG: isoaspartyl peptidase/L-asparaginase [Bacteroidetes bacterium]|nr:isoaspartyl peptidase/L-asparaginase [Bacteroidota bacterium]HET6246000.1 isoaspartyl peptidase/L-asparaginase [Bacteroidia bacterium]
MKKNYRLILVLGIQLISFSTICAQDKNIVFMIHGGAGTILKKNMTPEKEKEYTDKMEEAVTLGYKILINGGSGLDAIESAIKILEDSPLFNAGKGAVFTHDKRNELDASIMDGKTLKAGAVAGVTTIKNPITAARSVMENSPHVLMVGKGAEKFAREQNLVLVDPSYFKDEKRLEQLKKLQEKEQKSKGLKDGSGYVLPLELKDYKYGTVGAVALDSHGNLSAGTSTGGMTNKKYGRIGDSPIIGAGTYANNKTCAVSSTGHGEYFIRSVVAHDISAMMEYKGYSVDEASNEVINKKLINIGGDGGVIALDSQGNYSMTFNTDGMFRAVIDKDGKMFIKIYKD